MIKVINQIYLIMKIKFLLFAFILFGSKILFGQTYYELLGRPTDSSMTINVLFNQSVDVYWEYGTSSGVYTNTINTSVANSNTPLVAVFSNLIPNTKYFYRTRYRINGSSSSYLASAEHTFYTQRASGSTFTFTVEADEHLYDYGSSTLYKYTLQNEALDMPDFMISLGDIFGDDHYPLTITSSECNSLHLAYRAALGNICHSVPFYVCLGNHEGEKQYYLDSMPPNNLAVWSTIWRNYYYPNPVPNNFYSGNTISEGYGIGEPADYYAWTWGDALFVVLDAYRFDCYNTPLVAKPNSWDWTLGLTQYTWLKNTLENSKAKYKFVFAHHVSGESRGGIVPAQLYEWGGLNKVGGTNQFATNRPGWAKPIHQLFVDNGVNIFFQGHDHLFAHEVLNNVVYQEVPMAADSTYIKGMLANASAYTSDTMNASGHMRVTVSPSCVKVDYVRAFLPKDTISGVNHNREVSYSYTIGSCTTGIKNNIENYSISIYPNPAENQITINSNQLPIKQIAINDLEGRTILTKNLFQNSLNSNIIDVSNIPNGIYFINIKSNIGEENKKIIINR